jgi:hypothetical protein
VEHLDDTSQPEAENGTRSVCKIFLGVAALPDGERLWTFFCLRPEFIISIRGEPITKGASGYGNHRRKR